MKKRILFVDYSRCNTAGGITTFFKNMLPIFRENNVEIDVLNVKNDNEAVIHSYITQYYDVINDWLYAIPSDLLRHFQFFEDKLHDIRDSEWELHNPIVDYGIVKKIHECLHYGYYDMVFVNHHFLIPAILNYVPLVDHIPVLHYTHDAGVYMKDGESNPKSLFYSTIDDALMKAGSKNIFGTQMDSLGKYVTKKFGGQYYTLGMPLDVEFIHKFFDDSKKEDACLYIGRWDIERKNNIQWVRAVRDAGVKGIAIFHSYKEAEECKRACEREGLSNVEVYSELTREQHLQISNRCKVFYISSNAETFSYTQYENLNLMTIISPRDKQWAKWTRKILPTLSDKSNPAQAILQAIKTYSKKRVEQQYQYLKNYNKAVRHQWADFFNNSRFFNK